MSKYDPPQCQTCADYWIKEGRPLGNFLIVSKVLTYQVSSMIKHHLEEEEENLVAYSLEGPQKKRHIMSSWLRSNNFSAKLDNANKEIKYIKAELKRRNSGKSMGESGGFKSGGADHSFP